MSTFTPIIERPVYRTRYFRGKPVQFVLSDRTVVDLPWHVHGDLMIALEMDASGQRDWIARLRDLTVEMHPTRCEGEAVLPMPLAAGLALIRSLRGVREQLATTIDELDFVDMVFDVTLPMLRCIPLIDRSFLLTSATDLALCDLSRQKFDRYCNPSWPRFDGGAA